AGHLAQPSLQIADDLLVAHCLVSGGEGVQLADFGPGYRYHLGRGIELHGARAQRNHAMGKAQVLVFELFHVAQQLVLGVVRVEDGVREVLAGALEVVGPGQRQLGFGGGGGRGGYLFT
nr:hypothetical protein [Tanacetum cinerariifolium]